MKAYLGLLQKHGLKLWLTIFLGNLITSIMTGFLMFILVFAGIIIAGVGLGKTVDQLDAMSDIEVFHAVINALTSPAILISLLIVSLLIIVISLIVESFLVAGSYGMTVEAVESNHSEMGTFFTKGFKYLIKMAGVKLLSGLLYLFGAALIIYPLYEMSSKGLSVYHVPSILIGLALDVFTFLAFMHAPVILIAENSNPWKAISNSYQLFRKSFSKVFETALYIFLILILFCITCVPLLFLVGMLSGYPHQEESLIWQLSSMLFNIVIPPAMMAIIYLLITYRYHTYLRYHIYPSPDPLLSNQTDECDTPSSEESKRDTPSGEDNESDTPGAEGSQDNSPDTEKTVDQDISE